ncbi:DUF5011 domain-containing protein [Niameybacter massiliensis]|uniref:chitinase n=1 Tax=Holtiella tumoricola TaxID=3018743 RepID=A0AA42DJP9_9FIRM|nr:immunoglobulin-like domain-containing protein [Holtiella tumoricola]MDA3730137.1 DUF5011 domain-containing protein [Holtiella tumoricola]
MKLFKRFMSRAALVSTLAMVLGGMVITNPVQLQALETSSFEYKSQANTKRNVMYYGDWSVWGGQGNFYPQDIPADQLTHLNFAFLDFDNQGNLIFTDKDAAIGNPLGQPGVTWGDISAGILPALVELRAQNPNLKIGVSIGGWSKSGDFSEVAANPAKRAKFVENIVKFVEYTNMDFVDIDWEYPAFVREADTVDNKNDEGTPNARPDDRENYILLLEDIREALNIKEVELGKEYELSVALPASQDKLATGVDVQRMFEIIDFGNLMTYDMRGAFDEISGHQAGLYPNSNDPYKDRKYTIDEAVQYMIGEGAPAEKLVVGAAYYTRGWEKVSGGTDPSNPGLFGEAAIVGKDADFTPSRGAANDSPITMGDGGRRSGVWAYRNLDKLKTAYPGLKEYWDDEAKAPYLYSEQTGAFFTYDNVRSITEKANYVNENDLGGMIAWMASMDAPTRSSKRDELTKATKQGLYGNAVLPQYEIVYADLDITVTLTPYMESWGNTGGYEITIKNNEVLEESNTVLSATEKMAETITLPKFYIKHVNGPLTSGDYKAGTVTQEGEYTVVDLSSVYDARQIEAGGTYTFRLKANGPVEDVSGIESIELAQRLNKQGKEIKRQTIYGSTEQVNQAPVIHGAENKTITVGDTFDAMLGVTARDKEDGDLTHVVTVEGSVNTEIEGTYTLTYKVVDSEGLETVVERTITIAAKKPNQAPELKGINDVIVKVGSTFDTMAGVTATDKEDGDLTHLIQVEGDVDTTHVGTYTLTYRVADCEGLEAEASRQVVVEEVTVPEIPGSDFGVGEGIMWPVQVNAPFVDMAAWVTKPGYGNNGAPNLVKIAEDTDVKFFNLGFIQSVGGQIKDGKLVWGWGGHQVLSEAAPDNSQYMGIKQSIKELRKMGGDVTISLGGLVGTAFWQATQDVDVLTNTYMDLVTGYGLTRLDLDIEGSAQNKQQNIINAKAIKKVQDATGVEIVLTLAVLPSGLTSDGLGVLEAYLAEGVEVSVVNLMTMCYGEATLLPGENYGTGSLRAVDSTKDQLKDYYKRFVGVTLTDEEAYAKLGTTPSIGFEGQAHPIFTTEWAQLVVDHAIEKGIGMTSFWSMNRDAQLENNQGVPSQYAFTNIFKGFGTGEIPQANTKPVIHGVQDVTLTVGDTFDAMEGVTATDKEDGDLTSAIKVNEVVDTEVVGTYELVYTVSDSEELETIATRSVIVEEKVNARPQIHGVKDVKLTVGDTFDAMEGVTATDKEDGDLTSAIKVSGAVDTEVAGTYELVYRVSDSEGLEATATRIVVVEEKANTKPVIHGVKDMTLTVGDTFDAMEGVTATDAEDGDLTATIKVSGIVDTEVAGTYKLVYTVSDSKGLEATATRTVVVKEKPDPNNTYNPEEIYNAGDKVMYNGKEYTAKWWTKGDIPGQSDVWEAKIETNPDGSQDYIPGKTYVEGDRVVYNGKTYVAKWWTNSTPGSDSSWGLEGDEGEENNQGYIPGNAYVAGDIVTYQGVQYRAKWWTNTEPGSDDSWELVQ